MKIIVYKKSSIKNFFLKIVCIALLLNSCSKEDDIIPALEPEIISFSIKEIQSDFLINSDNNTIETTLKQEIDLTTLTAIFTTPKNAKVFVGNTVQVSGFTKNDFSNTVRYIVENEEGTKITYAVKINPSPKITSFKIKELTDISFAISDLDITANVPAGTNLTDVTAEFVVTQNATLTISGVSQTSGQTKNDFTNPVKYTLKGTNGDTKEYTVTIKQDPNNLPVANAGDDKVAILPSGQATLQVTLDGSQSSDIEGPISKFEWKLNGNIVGTTEISTVELGLGNYTLELTVTDNVGDTHSDTININVKQQGQYTPIDTDASQETRNLYQNIGDIADGDKFIFGQEFPMSFQLNNLRNSLNTSDCKDVVGEHPGVYGIDPNYMLYKGATQKQLHIDEAKYAYNQGSIVTFDFHQESRTDGKIYYDAITTDTDKSLMYDIVNDLNGSRGWFYSELDQVLDIINNDLGFPIVFRLFHEMDGSWFWWGTQTKNHSPELYIDLYKLAADYIKDRTKLVLFGWTPNQRITESYYPGDNYVDVVGIDVYNPSKSTLKNRLIELSTFALNRGKVAILSETGFSNYVTDNPTFWSETVLEAIEEGGSDIRLAWTLAWFNAPWDSSQTDLFIPNSNSSAAVKEDFVKFYDSPLTLFQQEVKNLNVYN